MNKSISNLTSDQLLKFQQIFGTQIGSSNSCGIECNHINIYEFKNWKKEYIDKYEDMKNKFNNMVEGVKMNIIGYSDYEVEYDEDRTYPATLTFTIEKI